MLKIYGNAFSSPANKVRMCANAMELEFDYVHIDLLTGEQRSEEHKLRHPAGKIPCIEDDGFRLFESNAICKYLARKHASSLYPDQLHAQAEVDQWCDFISAHLGQNYTNAFFNKIVAPMMEREVNEMSMKAGFHFIKEQLPIFDKQLANGPYLTGEQFTIADICLLATIDPSELLELEISQYRNLNSWREELRNQEFYQSVHKFYGDGLLE